MRTLTVRTLVSALLIFGVVAAAVLDVPSPRADVAVSAR
jgi:hypothetical protein